MPVCRENQRSVSWLKTEIEHWSLSPGLKYITFPVIFAHYYPPLLEKCFLPDLYRTFITTLISTMSYKSFIVHIFMLCIFSLLLLIPTAHQTFVTLCYTIRSFCHLVQRPPTILCHWPVSCKKTFP